jgi:hypothetical protein
MAFFFRFLHLGFIAPILAITVQQKSPRDP